jgi:hypothetical protein
VTIREVSFPPANSTVPLADMAYPEWPEPLTSCAGYRYPVGLPITLQLGADQIVSLSTYSLEDQTTGQQLQSCGFDAATYTNPNLGQQAVGRSALKSFGAVVLIPREPLSPGHTYKVTMNIDGANDSWSFKVRSPTEVARSERAAAAP